MKKKNNTFEEIWKKLKSCKKILISLHRGPDGDGFGSSVAMKYILEKELNCEVKLISKDNLNENLEEFIFSKEIDFGMGLNDINLKEFNIILLLDHGALTYYSEDIEKNLKNSFVINIDHHPTNNFFGEMNYVDSTSPSTCSILVEFFQKIKIEFDGELSRRLFLGICTDTKFFRDGDSLDTIKKAAFLIEKGNINYGKEFFAPINNKSWNMAKLQGILLSNMQNKEIRGKKIIYSFVAKEDVKKYKLNLSEIRLGINCMLDIKEVDVIFTLIEINNGIKGSFRSSIIDTSIFSAELGGGGHKKASAFFLKSMPMHKAVEKVLNTIEKAGIH